MAGDGGTVSLVRAYLDEGYPMFIAEALDDLGIQQSMLELMSIEEVMDKVLCWQGIIGYTGQILGAIKFLESQGRR